MLLVLAILLLLLFGGLGFLSHAFWIGLLVVAALVVFHFSTDRRL